MTKSDTVVCCGEEAWSTKKTVKIREREREREAWMERSML